MAVYVEGLRNVPLLLWILLIFALMIAINAATADFRGAEPAASMDFLIVSRLQIVAFIFPLLNLLIPILLKHGLTGFSCGDCRQFSLSAGWEMGNLRNKRRQVFVRPLVYQSCGVFIAPLAILFVAMGAHLDIPFLKWFQFSGGIHLHVIR